MTRFQSRLSAGIGWDGEGSGG